LKVANQILLSAVGTVFLSASLSCAKNTKKSPSEKKLAPACDSQGGQANANCSTPTPAPTPLPPVVRDPLNQTGSPIPLGTNGQPNIIWSSPSPSPSPTVGGFPYGTGPNGTTNVNCNQPGVYCQNGGQPTFPNADMLGAILAQAKLQQCLGLLNNQRASTEGLWPVYQNEISTKDNIINSAIASMLFGQAVPTYIDRSVGQRIMLMKGSNVGGALIGPQIWAFTNPQALYCIDMNLVGNQIDILTCNPNNVVFNSNNKDYLNQIRVRAVQCY
jgi:hypothetical protein